jgi:DNA polymerase III subunit beta
VNITVNSQLLAAELRLLAKVVPSKPTVAILSHALFRAEPAINGGALHMYATDLEVGITTQCDSVVNQPGETALPVVRLLQMVERFPDADVSIVATGSQVTIACGSFTTRMKAMPVADFPEPAVVDGVAHMFDGATLRDLIAKTRHAVSAVGTKFVLKGALLTTSQTSAAMVTTDGKRLAAATMTVAEAPASEIIIPIKMLDVLSSQGIEGDVQINDGWRHLFFTVGTKLLTSRKLEGAFPKYKAIIPKDNPNTVTIERHVLADALQRVTLVAEENGAVYFDVKPGTLGLTSASAGIGSADEAMDITYDGPPVKICLNGTFVLNFLDSCIGTVVLMKMKDAVSAVLLLDGEDHFGVIMAMRV